MYAQVLNLINIMILENKTKGKKKMERVIFVPQYPANMRYQQWWFIRIPDELAKQGFIVETLGKYSLTGTEKANRAMFSPIKTAIEFETIQINHFLELDLREDDILFLADISFPGIFSNVLFHKRPKRMFAFCHATSLNILDYFAEDHQIKFPIESAHSKMFDAIFIGSNYHEDKLRWSNTLVTRLPYPPFRYSFDSEKKYDIVSVSRPTPQKVDDEVEKLVEEHFNTEIIRKEFDSWSDYYSFLSQSKVLLITSKEETFGYQIIDAIISGCIPLAPNKFSYPELLDRMYLYDNREELLERIEEGLDGLLEKPTILCHDEMVDFYKNIGEVLRG